MLLRLLLTIKVHEAYRDILILQVKASNYRELYEDLQRGWKQEQPRLLIEASNPLVSIDSPLSPRQALGYSHQVPGEKARWESALSRACRAAAGDLEVAT